jgi:hypothetical protein
MLLANQTVGKAGSFANRSLPTAVVSLLAKVTAAELTASPPSPMVHMAVGEAFPTGPAFLLVKSSFPSLKTPTVLSQQELGNPVGKAFANRVGVFANSLALLAKRAFPVVVHACGSRVQDAGCECVISTGRQWNFSVAGKLDGSQGVVKVYAM